MDIVFQAQQDAVDIVNTSSHPKNRIAATIFHNEKKWSYAEVNQWPKLIDDSLGREQRIGSASGTIHAETACIFKAAFQNNHAIEGASFAITDPPCPNCVKNMAEAGIDNIYIDHKGFQKDFAQRRIDQFNSMSMRLAERAGISMYEVNRKEKKIIPITIANKSYIPVNEEPLQIIKEEPYKNFKTMEHDKKIAYCFVQSDNKKMQLICSSHPAIGFTHQNDEDEIQHPETSYSYIQEACNRLIMNVARRGLRVLNSEIYVNITPTSRELVNLVGANIDKIHIFNTESNNDTDSREALEILKEKKIITVF